MPKGLTAEELEDVCREIPVLGAWLKKNGTVAAPTPRQVNSPEEERRRADALERSKDPVSIGDALRQALK